jgi:hypothetical protein
MHDCVTQYKKALKKSLRCSSSVKERLLGRFDLSLSAFLEDSPNPTMTEMNAAFGSPRDMASVLMEGVSAEENSKYRKTRLITKTIAGIVTGVLLTLVIVFTLYIYYEKQIPVVHDDAVYVEDSVDAGDEIIVDDEIVIEDEVIVED